MAKKIAIPTDNIIAFFKQIPNKLKQIPKKIGPFFQSLPNRLANLPKTIMSAPTDEKIAYGVIAGGILFLIIGIII